MKVAFQRLLCASVALILVAGTCVAAEIAGDTFHLTLPDVYGAAVKSTTNKDNIETTAWVAKSPSGEAVIVSVSKMPAKIADPAKLMDSTRDSLIKSVNGALDSEENLGGTTPARKLVFHSGTQAFLRARLAVDGDRLYDVLYVGRSEEQRNLPGVQQIFDSFQITPAAAPAAAPAPAPATTTTGR